jgi:outer membrane protein TolC
MLYFTPILLISICLITLDSKALVVTSGNIKAFIEEKNAKVAAKKQEKLAAREREGFLARSFFPALTIYGSQDSFKIGSLDPRIQPRYGAELKINLFNGGRDKIENEVRLLKTTKIDFQTQRVSFEELEKARTLYWQILYHKEKIKLLDEALTLNKQNLNFAQKRIRSWVATNSDKFEFEMKEVELKAQKEKRR